MNFQFKVIEVAQNVNGYRYQLQMVNNGQSNGNISIFSSTSLAGYVLNATVEITTGTPVAGE